MTTLAPFRTTLIHPLPSAPTAAAKRLLLASPYSTASATLARPCSIIAPAATIRYRQNNSSSSSLQHGQQRSFSLLGFTTTSKIPKAVQSTTILETLHSTHPLPMRDEFMGTKRLTTKDLEAIPIDLTSHREPAGVSDWIAYQVVKSLRLPVDLFFRKKYIHRVVALETVAAVPGMVAGLLRHLRSLRRCSHDGGWISHLLHEAENERMHLLTWMKVAQPTFIERALVTAVQGTFFNVFFLLYIISDRTAHRVVGYLEEQAVISYTHMIEEIDNGVLKDGPAPQIAIDYWHLEHNATIRDVCLAMRIDENLHMETNHHLSDRIALKQEDLRVDIEKMQKEHGMVPNQNAEKVWTKGDKY
ncbi:hypothetical protein BGZ99_005264 [Dissophora globulifera]|uniref:Alternative oxidase n=1 Tax=Dissophora globulifera TaxID=979702 RepID=A0A9P6RFJ7_9FUNG|nr:hypothetical protein BGZ99_005264 [Dissophora globulifera]